MAPLRLQLTSARVSVAALAMWCCSLPLTGLALARGSDGYTGFTILAWGWLTPIGGNFAWIANVFFLYGIFRLLSGGAPLKSAVIAVVLSLDTLRFSQAPAGSIGSYTPVWGYGWGAVLWFFAIAVMLVAVGMRRRENDARNQPPVRRDWVQPLSLVFLSVAVGGASYLAIHDRMVANPAETKRLANVAFKRGKVCGTPEPVAALPIKNLSGPVEVVSAWDLGRGVSPLTDIDDLLKWGIPTVRISGRDYSVKKEAGRQLYSSVPATGLPAAILTVSRPGNQLTRVTLVETSANRTVFDQVWESYPDDEYCPDFSSMPRLNEQPRKLVMQALDLREPDTGSSEIVQTQQAFKNGETRIIDRKPGGDTFAMERARWKDRHPDRNTMPRRDALNTNCPSDVGWDDEMYAIVAKIGYPFMVKSKAFFLGRHARYESTCEGDFVYIYDSYVSDGWYHMKIEKRAIQGFRPVWTGGIGFSDATPFTRERILRLRSVKETSDSVTFELVNGESGEILFVRASLQGK